MWFSVIISSEKEQHAKHLQHLEDDMETQVQKVEQRVRTEVTLTSLCDLTVTQLSSLPNSPINHE